MRAPGIGHIAVPVAVPVRVVLATAAGPQRLVDIATAIERDRSGARIGKGVTDFSRWRSPNPMYS